eukprot:c13349_g1_i1.p1 GENE.c13349_g1_i1~~c13349_g1_i1.p1  ORF type:complete len:617 (-),score=184.27 c13349_g1_i1:65-1855(-)
MASIIQSITPEDSATVELLRSIGQSHIVDAWPAAGVDDDKKCALLEQTRKLDSDYPGGMKAYVDNAKKLLRASLAGENPYDGFEVVVPQGERLSPGEPAFDEAEAIGSKELAGVCFVIVAGGLGERLGYSGIKLELPSEITTGWSFLELYCKNVLALQDRARKFASNDTIVVPLCIMTSGDTHEKTIELLEKHNYFGVKNQLTIVKQEKVPALVNNDGQFALDDTYTISTKPHGHGDVHTLLHSKGVVKAWLDAGKKWVCFLQDTNGLVFRSLTAAVGVSAKHSFVLNSLTVPRRPGEAVGGICRLQHPDGRSITINVEYNQLDPMLRAGGKGGDQADSTGYSPFPGNTNVLVFALAPYAQTLARTNGSMPEFVNPKYGDAAKTTFKKPTRLECMMQDFPRLLTPEDKVGFTQLDRWISFSAVKNNVADAVDKVKQTGIAESASSGEADIYYVSRRVLADHGVKVAVEGSKTTYAGVAVSEGAHVVLGPSFACTLAEIRQRFPQPSSVSISDKSTLVLEGDVVVESLELDGTLIVRAQQGAQVVIRDLKVKNSGYQFKPITPSDNQPEMYQIRGYVLDKQAADEHVFSTSGSHVLA